MMVMMPGCQDATCEAVGACFFSIDHALLLSILQMLFKWGWGPLPRPARIETETCYTQRHAWKAAARAGSGKQAAEGERGRAESSPERGRRASERGGSKDKAERTETTASSKQSAAAGRTGGQGTEGQVKPKGY